MSCILWKNKILVFIGDGSSHMSGQVVMATFQSSEIIEENRGQLSSQVPILWTSSKPFSIYFCYERYN